MKTISISTFLIFSVIFCSCQETNIPITTDSQEARDLFIQGQDLIDKLRVPESLSYFEKAAKLDTNFALVYLNMALAATNTIERLQYIEKAKSKLEMVSKGEQLLILGMYAGFMGLPGKQREHYEKLVELYPDDPRAHSTLGNQYFGNQEYNLAINQYKIASKLDPEFTQPYNQIGYAYRFLGDYTKAETAFKKYVSLIPDDPNPYDSYAELLLEMGEYEVSIENYEKAIKLNPDFFNSYLGIATNLNLKGEHGLARKKLKELFYQLEDNGIRRMALGAMAISYIDEGKFDVAIKLIEKRLAISTSISDTLAMAGDNNFIGVVLREKGEIDEAVNKFTQVMRLVSESGNPEDIKNLWKRILYYQHSRNSLLYGNLTEAWEYQKKYLQAATDAGSIFQIKAAYELAGRILYEEEKFNDAISAFEKSNLQNPYNIYFIGLAYEAKGDIETAKKYFQRSAGANSYNNLNYSFVRKKAEKRLIILRR